MRSLQIICAILLIKIKIITVTTIPSTYVMEDGYDKNSRPSTSLTDVTIGLYLNRISAVDENKEEISFDVFLQVIWEDKRIRHRNELNYTNSTTTPPYTVENNFIDLKVDERHKIWVPDLYIRQLREMKVLTLFEEISSLRLYRNSTLVFSLGATIIIKCDMDFVLYPLDVQKCPVDFSSYKYSVKDMRFRWKRENPITFPKDFGAGFFRLPKYVVSFSTEKDPHIVNYGDADHHSARMEITLSREVKSYLLENYLPSTLFVSMSWGSFVVVPEIVPGRMVLLVTTLLSLVTMFDTVRNNSPDALELKCIEVWLISCTLFVFLALMEYFIVLFGIRYDKHWRTAKTKIQSMASVAVAAAAVTSVGGGGGGVGSGGGGITTTIASPINAANTTTTLTNPTTTTTALTTRSETPTRSQQRKNGLVQTARPFPNLNKITPENKKKITYLLGPAPMASPENITIQPLDNNTTTTIGGTTTTMVMADGVRGVSGGGLGGGGNGIAPNPNNVTKKRFRNAAEIALLYAGSQNGRLDQISLVLFPVTFIIFTIIYWILYLTESRKRM